jgi:hypothetical protein
MPIAIAVDHATHTVVATATGMITVTDLIDFIQHDRVGNLASYALIFDACDARTDVIGTDVRRAADEALAIAQRERRGPAAIVASGSNYGLARMYETLLAGLDIQVRAFHNRHDAETWLASFRVGPHA